MPYEEDGGLSFLRQNRVGIIITALLLAGVAFVSFKFLFLPAARSGIHRTLS